MAPKTSFPADDRSSIATALRERFDRKTATIAVVGLGYVGLPLVRAVHNAGFRTIGFDTDTTKISTLRQGGSYLHHLGEELARTLAASERFEATSNPKSLAAADAILMCVPTPLGPHREPDLSFVLDSTKMIATMLRKGQLVVLESTTYPGTTRDELLPILQATGLRCGEDFFLAYSPEREDPGRADHTTSSIPKLVGGVDEPSSEMAVALYSNLVSQVHRVASAEIAEAAKLLENIYRAVNIALVNEMKMLLADMDIDIWEVIQAASTKPFGFQPFYPGPGLGGHCIPIDPFYLTWKAKSIGRSTKFIELAGEINAQMPTYVVSQLISALNDRGRALRDTKVLVIGIAYKPNIDDIRESPAAEIIELLWSGGVVVTYHDPHVPAFPKMRDHQIDLASVPLTEQTLQEHDCVLIVTNHDAIDYELIARHAKLIIDTRHAMAKVKDVHAPVVQS
ncbi:MAG: nucleotide sugar dehydrogenase [Planctomycetes bacterium]|nr:nucleotide sugar dehydrogenase [Planctomycetota bacterium]